MTSFPLSQSEIVHLFSITLPPDVTINIVPLKEYIGNALNHPFIQHQIRLGVYTKESIWGDFLSPSASFMRPRIVEVCYDLLGLLAVGVEDGALIKGYIQNLALHEAHHFEINDDPITWQEHAENELECIQATAVANPAVTVKADKFEQASLAFQRVSARIQAIMEADNDERASALP